MDLRPFAGWLPARRAKARGDEQSAGQVGSGDPLQPMTFTSTAVGAPILVDHGVALQRALPAAARGRLGAAAVSGLIERNRQRSISGIGVDDGGGRP